MAPIDSPPSAYETSYDPNAPVGGLPPTATIVQIYPAIMREKAESIRKAAHGWNRLCSAVWATYYHVGENGTKLRSHWKSGAAEYFFPYVDGTRASLDEWQNVCYTNYTVLFNLADTVQSLQSVMHEIWERFTGEQNKNYDAENSSGFGEFLNDAGEALSGRTRIDNTLEQFTTEAVQKVLTPFSNAFSTAWSAITVGNKFQGPTDAEKPADGAIERIARVLAPRPDGLGRPGVVPGAFPAPGRPAVAPSAQPVMPAPGRPQPPSVSASPPDAPDLPSLPPRSDTRTQQDAPTQPDARTQQDAPTQPDVPTQPTAPILPRGSAPAAPELPLVPPSGPSVPEFPLPADIPPVGIGSTVTAADLARSAPPPPGADVGVTPPDSPAGGGMLERAPALQGRGVGGPSPTTPPADDAMPPQLRGRSGAGRGPQRPTPKPGESGRITFPGAGPGSRSLLGRREPAINEYGRRLEPPFTGTGAPRQLQGIRGPDRNRTDAAFESDREETRGLTGRLATSGVPGEEMLESAARQALRPGLGGRGRPVSRRQDEPRTDRERQTGPVYLGTDERFEVDKPTAILERADGAPVVSHAVAALRPAD